LSDDLQDRGMPASPDIERALLGLLLMEFRRYWPTCSAELEEEDFSLDSHRRIFKVYLKMAEASRHVDQMTVVEHMRRSHELDAVGGIAYVLSLTEGVVLRTVAGVLEYCQILKERSAMRELIHAGNALTTGGLDQADAPVVADDAIRNLQRISARANGRGLRPMAAYYQEAYGSLENFQRRPGQKRGLQTSWRRYNEMTGGLQAGELIIIAARPSMGKTTWAVNLAHELSINQRLRGGFFSLEQSEKGILDRLVCSIADLSMAEVTDESGLITSDYVKRALAEIEASPLLIDDTSKLTAQQIVAKAEMAGALDYLLVDYLQYMESKTSRDLNRDRELGIYCKVLRDYGKRHNIPVICLAQLRREVEGRIDKKPRLSDLRESGNIEQDADTIAFIHRPEYYDRNNDEVAGIADFMIAKQRNGPTGDVRVKANLAHYRFHD
jgi:replicative DNA helicase